MCVTADGRLHYRHTQSPHTKGQWRVLTTPITPLSHPLLTAHFSRIVSMVGLYYMFAGFLVCEHSDDSFRWGGATRSMDFVLPHVGIYW